MANTEAGSAYVSIIPSMKGFQKTIGGAFSKIGRVAAVGFGVVMAAAAAAGAAALKSYAEYEQLAGGAEKLFEGASGQIKAYADNAYKTAGMSANQYLKQATSFSASLKKSLGGDVVKAAQQSDVAMRSMADNVSIFGSNMDDVQNAYQGFAKQNYTMLDNLKLGYGGTKTEMEKLIADANEWGKANGKASDLSIDSFSDVVTAIEYIQEKQGIAGNAAKEAATTIEGSMGMAKAAWENLLTGLARDDVDLSQLTKNLLDAIGAVANNVVPVIKKIAGAIASNLPSALSEALNAAWRFAQDSLRNVGIHLPYIDFGDIGAKLSDAFGKLDLSPITKQLSFIDDFISTLVGQVYANMPSIQAAIGGLQGVIQTVADSIAGFKQGFNEAFNDPEVQAAIANLQATLQPFYTDVLVPLGAFISGTLAPILGHIAAGTIGLIATGIKAVMVVINDISVVIQTVVGVVQGAVSNVQAAVATISGAINIAHTAISNAMGAINSAFHWVFDPLVGWITGIFNGVKSAIQNPMQAAKDAVKRIIDSIKGFFNFHISWPHIPVPHFSISPAGWHVGDLLTGSIPSLGISWYRKGGIATEPTIAAGYGEAGGELFWPSYGPYLDKYASAITDHMDGTGKIDYDRLGDAVANAFVRAGIGVSIDGRAFGKMVREYA
ncbi:hypothetical protein [uncultured Olegusella sp.]|uniref:hypothetical protein n=1 Tax=uncultured Olegusella sp. TaxID=1979846 RepID=UPI00261B1912|nr:hypothetical protein [uncultured Olegusella sp.]